MEKSPGILVHQRSFGGAAGSLAAWLDALIHRESLRTRKDPRYLIGKYQKYRLMICYQNNQIIVGKK